MDTRRTLAVQVGQKASVPWLLILAAFDALARAVISCYEPTDNPGQVVNRWANNHPYSFVIQWRHHAREDSGMSWDQIDRVQPHMLNVVQTETPETLNKAIFGG